MTAHNIFYYPYAAFRAEQSPLLKAAALYFDKLHILDPLKASWDWIGPGPQDQDLYLLDQVGVLDRVAPEDVLKQFESAIADAIRADLQDQEYLQLCESSGRAGRWTLALAKIPREIRDDPEFQPRDRAMQQLMGDLAREASDELAGYDEVYAAGSEVYDEYRESDVGVMEYRYADYPLALGESIMINHALFGSLLHTGATPLTDDPFHSAVLAFKIERARRIPALRDLLDDRAALRKMKADQLAMSTLTDLDLAILSPEMPLEEILEYRHDHDAELQAARAELGWLAREIRQQPWSAEFADEVEHRVIPGLRGTLADGRAARDAWLQSDRGKNALRLTGLAAGTAAATLSLVLSPTPLLPVAVVTGVLGLVGGTIAPGLELLLDWRQGKKEALENGLHYLIELKS